MENSKKISFSWDIHWACNYRCPYCWWHGRWDELAKRNCYPGVEKLISIWKNIHDRYGEVHLEIAGGEPTIYPDFCAFIGELLNYHTVGMMTNLSGDLDPFLRNTPREILINRIKIGASFHPLFSDLNSFMQKAVNIRRMGMSIGVLYLAYPSQIKDIPKYKQVFAENDIFFEVSTFWGTYNGKDYPQSYTEEELLIINPELGKRRGESFQTQPLVTKGKLCNAGHTYGIIHPEGEVIRCGGGSWKGENIVIGNIFDDFFDLWKEPKPCHSEHCPCNEWAFLLLKENL